MVTTKDTSAAWDKAVASISKNGFFQSTTGIRYKARTDPHGIYYMGENRNNGEEETIIKAEFLQALDSLKNMNTINTNNIKDKIPRSLYRKRSPFIGILKSAGIIH